MWIYKLKKKKVKDPFLDLDVLDTRCWQPYFYTPIGTRWKMLSALHRLSSLSYNIKCRLQQSIWGGGRGQRIIVDLKNLSVVNCRIKHNVMIQSQWTNLIGSLTVSCSYTMLIFSCGGIFFLSAKTFRSRREEHHLQWRLQCQRSKVW